MCQKNLRISAATVLSRIYQIEMAHGSGRAAVIVCDFYDARTIVGRRGKDRGIGVGRDGSGALRYEMKRYARASYDGSRLMKL